MWSTRKDGSKTAPDANKSSSAPFIKPNEQPAKDEPVTSSENPDTSKTISTVPSLSAPTGPTLQRAWWRSYFGIASILFFTLVINVLKLTVPLYIFQLLDRVVSSRSVETLIMLTVITVAAVLTSAFTEYVRRWLLVKWGAWIERTFGRRLLLAGLREKPGAQIRPSRRLRDLSSLRTFLSGTSVIAWLDVIYVPAFILIVFLISPLISLVVIVSMLVILILGLLNESLSRTSRSAATKATQERADWLTAAERDPELMGSFNLASNVAKQWERSAASRLEQNLSTRKIALATGDSMRFVENCQRIACYGLGIWLVLEGSLTIGGVIAAAILGRTASGTFRRAMSSWRNLSSAYAAYGRVKKRLNDAQPDMHVTSDRREKLSLLIDDVGHRYRGQSTSLFRHVKLTLEPGEMLSVIGPTGSGKSTMARILSGRISPRTGMVRLGDAEISRFPPDELASRLGYLSQHTQLFRGTVRDNISGLSDEINDEELIAAAELVGVHKKIVSLPDGYETQISDGGSLFSAGERKQIALARVIHKWPDLIVLDDPESFQDEPARAALRETLTACKAKGMIVVITSQSMDLARISDKAILLKPNGRPVICRSRKEITELRRETKRSKPRIISSNDRTGREK